jgi:hypothetical protein
MLSQAWCGRHRDGRDLAQSCIPYVPGCGSARRRIASGRSTPISSLGAAWPRPFSFASPEDGHRCRSWPRGRVAPARNDAWASAGGRRRRRKIETPIPYCGGKWDRGSTRKRGRGMFRAPSTTGEGASRSRSFGNRVDPQRGGPTSLRGVTARGGRAYVRTPRDARARRDARGLSRSRAQRARSARYGMWPMPGALPNSIERS